MSDRVIVIRRPAAVEFVVQEIDRATLLLPMRRVYPETRYNGTYDYVHAYHTVGGAVRVAAEGGRVSTILVPVGWGERGFSAWTRPEALAGEAAGSIPILASAGPDDVRGRVVYGPLPLHLAALAREVVVVEFAARGECIHCGHDCREPYHSPSCISTGPPRGREYTLADMDAAGARLVRYRVESLGVPTQGAGK